MDAALFVEMLVATDASDVAGLAFGELLHEREGGRGAGPFFEHFADSPAVGEELQDAEVAEGLAGGVAGLLDGADPALAVDEGSAFFSPRGGGEEEVGGFCGLGGVIHVLNDKEI